MLIGLHAPSDLGGSIEGADFQAMPAHSHAHYHAPYAQALAQRCGKLRVSQLLHPDQGFFAYRAARYMTDILTRSDQTCASCLG